MWRAFFLAVGTYACILGAECLAIDKAVLKSRGGSGGESYLAGGDAAPRQEIVPPDWAPWSLMSGGAVTILYSFSIPKRVKTG